MIVPYDMCENTTGESTAASMDVGESTIAATTSAPTDADMNSAESVVPSEHCSNAMNKQLRSDTSLRCQAQRAALLKSLLNFLKRTLQDGTMAEALTNCTFSEQTAIYE
jgi:hypothetical protein